MAEAFEPQRATNLGRQVYEYLQAQIYEMAIEPGTPLNISETANQLGVSRSPVRDAFLMLVADGVIDPIPGGYRVIQFNRKYINDVFVLRRALELTSVRLCVENLNRSRVESLRDIWEQFKVADDTTPDFLARHLSADNDLHSSIAEMSNNALLKQSLDKVVSVAALIRRWQYSGGASHRHLASASQEHLKVIEAILAEDTDKSVAAMDEHLTLAHNRSLARLS